MNGKFGPETSRSSRGSLPNLVYTKPRPPTTPPEMGPQLRVLALLHRAVRRNLGG